VLRQSYSVTLAVSIQLFLTAAVREIQPVLGDVKGRIHMKGLIFGAR
jgi:hypothetical protein